MSYAPAGATADPIETVMNPLAPIVTIVVIAALYWWASR
jgi:hypothetical protein